MVDLVNVVVTQYLLKTHALYAKTTSQLPPCSLPTPGFWEQTHPHQKPPGHPGVCSPPKPLESAFAREPGPTQDRNTGPLILKPGRKERECGQETCLALTPPIFVAVSFWLPSIKEKQSPGPALAGAFGGRWGL